MNKIKTILTTCLAMIFCCVLFAGCSIESSNTENSPDSSYSSLIKGVSIKFSDEFYIECNSNNILTSDTNEIYVKKNTTIKPKFKDDFTDRISNSKNLKLDLTDSAIYKNIVINDEIISFEDFKTYSIKATKDIVVSLSESSLKLVGIALYQKTSANKNYSQVKKNPENIDELLTIKNDQVIADDIFLTYCTSFDDNTFLSNAANVVDSSILNNNSISRNINIEIFLETTEVIPSVICTDDENNFYLIHYDAVKIELNNNTQTILSLTDLKITDFNNLSAFTLIVSHNLSSVKK